MIFLLRGKNNFWTSKIVPGLATTGTYSRYTDDDAENDDNCSFTRAKIFSSAEESSSLHVAKQAVVTAA